MTLAAQEANTERARLIVEALLAADVDLVIVCPGARSTPLLAALGRCDDARLARVVLHDERTAGFAAVGAARAGRRAAVVTTSGTAVANLAPAMTEAAVADLPIVVVTADRPWELHGRGANQTVPQSTLFDGLGARLLDLPAPPDGASAALVARQLDDVLATVHQPVHINARFRKPLHPPADATPVVRRLKTRRAVLAAVDDLAALAAFVDGAQRGLVVVGELSASQRSGAQALVDRLRWPVIADITSSVSRQVPPAFARRSPAVAPDRVLWLGGRMTEPAVATWIAGTDAEVWQIDDRPSRRDPDALIGRTWAVSFAAAAGALASSGSADEAFTSAMAAAADSWEPTHLEDQEHERLTEPAVARAVLERAAEGSAVLLGASMPVRDADRFVRKLHDGVLVAANRGASGIDGQLGTALGLHLASRQPVTALLGDLTFLHDVGGLVALKQQRAAVRLVVVNNDGGGIFSLLPLGSAEDQLNPWFSAPHGQSAATIAAGFGVAACTPTTPDALAEALARPIGGPEVIEVHTNRAENAALHRALDGLRGQAVRP